MNAGDLPLIDHVLPDVPLRQFVITVPFPLRFPFAFYGKLLGQVLRIFIAPSGPRNPLKCAVPTRSGSRGCGPAGVSDAQKKPFEAQKKRPNHLWACPQQER
jgi:hypothetical protein